MPAPRLPIVASNICVPSREPGPTYPTSVPMIDPCIAPPPYRSAGLRGLGTSRRGACRSLLGDGTDILGLTSADFSFSVFFCLCSASMALIALSSNTPN